MKHARVGGSGGNKAEKYELVKDYRRGRKSIYDPMYEITRDGDRAGVDLSEVNWILINRHR